MAWTREEKVASLSEGQEDGGGFLLVVRLGRVEMKISELLEPIL